MSRCAVFYPPHPIDGGDAYMCPNEADGSYNCGYSDPVCAEHKCRCAGPPKKRQPYAAGRWIRTDERLPERFTNVLVWTSFGAPVVGFLDAGGLWAYCGGMLVAITHWAPIQEPGRQ